MTYGIMPLGPRDQAARTPPTDKKFTGQTLDPITGLYWYASRPYDPGLGRFTQPDTVVPQPGNPQSLNRHSYVLNNPLRYIDPTGHDDMDPEWEEAFRTEHGGQDPTAQDWVDRQVSLMIPGLGPGEAWTEADWEAWETMKEEGLVAYTPPVYASLMPTPTAALEPPVEQKPPVGITAFPTGAVWVAKSFHYAELFAAGGVAIGTGFFILGVGVPAAATGAPLTGGASLVAIPFLVIPGVVSIAGGVGLWTVIGWEIMRDIYGHD